jgi:hypothetical protein
VSKVAPYGDAESRANNRPLTRKSTRLIVEPAAGVTLARTATRPPTVVLALGAVRVTAGRASRSYVRGFTVGDQALLAVFQWL